MWWLICDQMNICIIFLRTYSNLIDNIEKLSQKKFLELLSGIGCDKMTYIVTKWTWISVFRHHFCIQLINCRNFCKINFKIGGQEQVVTKWLNLWPTEHQFQFSDIISVFIWSIVETFVKKVFWLEVRNRLWQNDLICDQMNTYFGFLILVLYSIDQI